MYPFMNTARFLVCGALAAMAMAESSPAAAADWIIKQPNRHPNYFIELEPHASMILWRRTIHRRFVTLDSEAGQTEFGGGARINFEIVDPVIPSLNNSIALGTGLDFMSCSSFCRNQVQVFLPAVAQWNFYLTQKWSVYANLGGVLRTTDLFSNTFFDFITELGGRYHFNDKVVLNMRVGYPFSIGIGPGFYLGSRDE